MGERVWSYQSRCRWVVCAACLLGVALAAGCTAPVKIPAIKNAVRKRDRNALRQLVADLDSDDPAVRFYAISGLERITGQRFGYDYYADEQRREPAVRRWREWLEARGQDRRHGDKVTR